MKNSTRLLYVSLIMIALSICGFYYYWGARDRNRVEDMIGMDPMISYSLWVERDHIYEISLMAEDNMGLPWNKLDVEASILFNDDVLHYDSFMVQEFPGKSAKEGFSFRADVRSDGLLQVEGLMRHGQRWRVTVYRDLPPFLEIGPFASAIIGLLGCIGVVQSKEV